MGRTIQISKNLMLQTGLDIILKEGHKALTVYKLAEEIGCSTQPILWQFGNMIQYKKELFAYCLNYLNGKMTPVGEKSLESYGTVGFSYVTAAFEEPNLLRFLKDDEMSLQASKKGIGYIFDASTNNHVSKGIAKQYGCSEQKAVLLMKKLIIFTEGLVTMILSGAIQLSQKMAIDILKDATDDFVCSVIKEK